MSTGAPSVMPLLVVAGAGALALGAAALWRATQRATSADEAPVHLPGAARGMEVRPAGGAPAAPGTSSTSAFLLADGELEGTVNRFAQTAMGQPYSWGAGGPGAPWPVGAAGERGGRGWDCSGLVAAAWSGLLLLPWAGPRFWTGSVEALCDGVAFGDQRPGDAVLYEGHITLVMTWPDGQGDSFVLSASNGGRDTNGDDPAANVKVFSSMRYRGDARKVLRPKAELAAAVSEGQREACLAVHALLAGQPLPPTGLGAGRRDELLRQFYGELDVVKAALGGAA